MIERRNAMRICIACALILITGAASSALAQRRRPVLSPVIESNGEVTFRLRADSADAVEVRGQWAEGRSPMSKGEDDIWQVTVGPVPPGVWEYSFSVDEMSMIDPGNSAIKPMRSPRSSILHIPGEPSLLHDFQDVPHGVVHLHTYRSQSLGRLRELAVYTPPSYEQLRDRRFPTLYLQHGSGDNHATWTVHGKAHWIADNLIAQRSAKPMVIVMMDGHASPPGAERGVNTEYFEKDLLGDVIPFVEARYRVQSNSANRGIVGLSMGGGQSLSVGLKHTDTFAWVGAFSSAIPRGDALSSTLTDPETTNGRLSLLWIGCGKEDRLLGRNETFIGQLRQEGIDHEWHLTEGDHSWPVWRTYLAEFIPKLFQ